MDIFPAIDLRDGRVVRLEKGDYGVMKTYSDSPAETARSFSEQGAGFLHVVDLDGAKSGEPVNFAAIEDIRAHVDMFIEVGGGIRDESAVQKYLGLGVDRVILGSAAVENFPWLTEMVKKYGDRIAVGVDARDGMAATGGWLNTTRIPAARFCTELAEAGVSAMIYTDIATDGMLSGTNLEAFRAVAGLTAKITASGGICKYEEITALKEMGLAAAIVGKALYEGVLELSEVLRLAGRDENC